VTSSIELSSLSPTRLSRHRESSLSVSSVSPDHNGSEERCQLPVEVEKIVSGTQPWGSVLVLLVKVSAPEGQSRCIPLR
jgi:hypothetical protein